MSLTEMGCLVMGCLVMGCLAMGLAIAYIEYIITVYSWLKVMMKSVLRTVKK